MPLGPITAAIVRVLPSVWPNRLKVPAAGVAGVATAGKVTSESITWLLFQLLGCTKVASVPSALALAKVCLMAMVFKWK